eukprot:TRINITY_DN2582_c0_g1_i1.p1 TRINITY_DN2582_c0_g1~~TRINITY_DN2582_c0_g1_i1.p1  ORF type:complete len:125 (-),score=12.23 TRINITY_DN2582_c0_g1_i1:39-413(-)
MHKFVFFFLAIIATFTFADLARSCVESGKGDKHSCERLAQIVGAFASNDMNQIVGNWTSGAVGNLKDHECTVWKNLKCAVHIFRCAEKCGQSVDDCIDCLGPLWNLCCPCINNDIHVRIDCSNP